MSIQFRCPGCNEPIEVDDIHAGQTAACPYCRRVASVPTESAPDMSAPTAARPGADADQRGSGSPPPLPQSDGSLHVGRSTSPREVTARRLANYALICMSITVLLFLGIVVYGISQMAPEVLGNPGSQPSQERMEELADQIGTAPLFAGASWGMPFFALVGVVLAIVSLTQSRVANWRAIVSLVVCGLFTLCTCGGVLLAAAGMVGAGA